MKTSNVMRAIPTPRPILVKELRPWDADAYFGGVASYAGVEFVGTEIETDAVTVTGATAEVDATGQGRGRAVRTIARYYFYVDLPTQRTWAYRI